MVKNLAVVGLVFMLGACSTMTPYQPLPPVKVITETVEVEIYAPPLPKEILLADVDWKVISNTPCKPATGTKNIGSGKWYYTTDRFQYEDYLKEDGTEARRVVRDAEGKRVELEQLTDDSGTVIQSCGNLQKKIAEIEILLDGDFVIFAVTPDGYERMAAYFGERAKGGAGFIVTGGIGPNSEVALTPTPRNSRPMTILLAIN